MLENIGLVEQGILDEWQERWDRLDKGRWTYKFLRDVDSVRNAPWINLDYRITCFLTGHGFFKAKLAKLGLEEVSVCGCSLEQTAEHLLMECQLTANCRRIALGDYRPDSVEWFTEREENFKKFGVLVNQIFEMHEEGIL